MNLEKIEVAQLHGELECGGMLGECIDLVLVSQSRWLQSERDDHKTIGHTSKRTNDRLDGTEGADG